MPQTYASNTSVSVSRSAAEIMDLVRRHGATESGTASTTTTFGVSFGLRNRLVRFQVPFPTAETLPRGATKRWGRKSASQRTAEAVQQETRRRWRALLLCIKGKLETVASGIKEFDEEFLAYIVTPSGRTVFQEIRGSETGALMLGAIQQEGRE